jgi:hypothetical protein
MGTATLNPFYINIYIIYIYIAMANTGWPDHFLVLKGRTHLLSRSKFECDTHMVSL